MALMSNTVEKMPEPLPMLRNLAAGRFLLGAAVRPDQMSEDPVGQLIGKHFNVLTAENVFKPALLQPKPGVFDFSTADRIAQFAASHEQALVGHTLCWHQQAPEWIFADPDGKPLARSQGLANLRKHIEAVLTHFKGKCLGWDVVNEAIDDKPDRYLRDTPALRSIGEDYLIQAFHIAREVDPGVELYYNDYAIDHGPKLDKVVRLIGELQQAGCRIDGVGNQAHWHLDWPSFDQIESGISTLARTGVEIHLTELDIDVLPRKSQSAEITEIQAKADSPEEDPYVAGLPDVIADRLAGRYAGVFEIFMRHASVIRRVTFWGVDDGSSWLNGFPVRGRRNYPLLFDRELQPKTAFWRVAEVLSKS
jgi:endo-1,4-beta-xylanase